MRRILLAATFLTAISGAGCCRMCCWQHGGSWNGGGCYLPQPAAQPVITQPIITQPPPGAPVVLPQQQTFVPSTAVPASASYMPATQCTCN